MKTILLHACAFLALAASASAVIFGVDAFDYPDGPVAGQSGGVSWDRTNAPFFSPSGGPSNWDNVVNAPTVLLGRLVTNNSSAKREYKGSPEGDGAFNNSSHAKAVYYRTTVTTGPTLPDFFGMSSYDFGFERVFFGKRFGAANFGVTIAPGILGGGTFHDSLIPVQPNTTYVLVARVDYDANTLRLYVNPDLTAAEPASASASLPWTNSEFSTAVRLASGNTGSPVTWDDITVATSWSDLALVVKSAADVDHGTLGDTQQSLRDCLKYGAKGSMILFAPSLNGQTISLTNALGELAVTSAALTGDYIVDASALANGITINDGAATGNRLLQVDSGARLEVRGVTFANSGAPSGSIDGGAVRNQGTLTLTRCTLSGNAAGNGSGGALYSTGSLLVNQCTFSGNSAASGGALESLGDSRLVHCTLAENTVVASGGGVRNSQGTTTLLHCTVAANTAGTSGGGVASAGDGPATTLVQHSILSGNAGGDVEFFGGALNSFTSQGRNLIGTGNATGDFNQPGDIINNLDPLLEPLGDYGGRTQTMPPLAGSLAIDAAAAIANLDADQRGFPRNRDGNDDGNFSQDIGAVEAVFRFVTNTNDSGAGSLRQTLLDSAAAAGFDAITFSSALDGGSISLTGTGDNAITVNDTGGVAIDATNLSNGLTITKPAGAYRLFDLIFGKVAFHGLTFTHGGGSGFSAVGGAMRNNADLTLTRCTLSDHSTTGQGGALANYGNLLLARCTLARNIGSHGGAIYSDASADFSLKSATLEQCTITENTADIFLGGGGVFNSFGLMTISHCTITGNNASEENGGGVASSQGPSSDDTRTVVRHSIISGNTGTDVHTVNLNNFQSLGRNVIGTGNAIGRFNQTGDITGVTDPLLSPFGSYGGPTQTMPPRPGSPAIDRAVALAGFGTDQRGFARNRDGNADGIAAPDSGAVEASILVVSNTNDAGAGSLRQVIADAAAASGPDTIIFAQSLNGGTISLTTSASGSALTVNDAAGVTIDASTLTNGPTITKPAGNYRLFRVASGSQLSLDSLTLTGGTSNDGGALLNFGNTTFTRCTLSGNTGAITAGAVLNEGTFTLDRCTVSVNTGVRGGGIYNDTGATTMVVNSTFTGNAATNTGGAIFNSGTLTVRHATIVENNAANDAGGISNGGTLTLGNTIIAGNFVGVSTTRSDLRGNGTFTTQGGNLVGSNGPLVIEFPAGLPNANNDYVGSATAPLDARLLPLGQYNGPTRTMPPRADSRAIDAGVNFGLDATDQRGFDRFADGDNNGISRPDSGAVEAVFQFVTNTNDSGSGSLRQAFANAAAAPGPDTVVFAAGLSGQTIILTNQIHFSDAPGITMDASSLPAGLTIAGPPNNRIFSFVATKADLTGLTLTGGHVPSDRGGAIVNFGSTVLLTRCTLANNSADEGGAISSLTGSNFATSGTTLSYCTLSGNSATSRGGAIHNDIGRTTLIHCTVSANTAPVNFGSGVSVNANGLARTEVQDTLIAGNTNSDVDLVFGTFNNTIVSQSHNLIGTGNATGAFNQPGDIINNTDPLLAPLDNYGGPTKTMALMPGSPARNTASGSGAAFDQRGFAIFGTPDIGAYEAGTLTNYNAFIWETLPATASVAQHAATFDFDGDGATNEGEYIAGTVVTNPASVFRVTSVTKVGNNLMWTFPTVAGRIYRYDYSYDLITWTPNPGGFQGNGSPLTLSLSIGGNPPRFFIRPRVGP